MPGISNSEIKRIRSLSVKKFRDLTGLFTVEGEKMVSEAMKSSFHVEKVYRAGDIVLTAEDFTGYTVTRA